MTFRDTERVGRTIATVGTASTALLHGEAGGLELLEGHLAVLRIQKDIPVLIAHSVWLADVIAVLRWM
jgi:hypothetical protein